MAKEFPAQTPAQHLGITDPLLALLINKAIWYVGREYEPPKASAKL